ncbi:hypothetical protein SpCBS45565_g04081 [Spizellomyces sp. 'palustris']|nr:hypothetical protein SpCBS45565_g04081 [Spizellomyces sp. 'palustris']
MVLFKLALLWLLGGSSAEPGHKETAFDVSRHLGSKGPYPYRATMKTPPLSDPPKGCRFQQVQLIARHGTRYPSVKEILSFDKLVQIFHQHRDDVRAPPWLHDWVNPFIPEDNNLLALIGEDEMYWLGKRAAKRYKGLFGSKPYSPHLYKFRSSTTSRTGQSGSAFAGGVFEGKGSSGTCKYQSVYQYTIPQVMDYELMPKWSCPLWSKVVEDHPFLSSQLDEWTSEHLPKMVSRLRKAMTKPGHDEIPLTSSHVKAIYRACAFEVSVFSRKDTWCTLLEPGEIRLLEYLDDLKHYWDLGYGFDLNAKVGCALATDVAKELTDAIEGRGRTQGIFRFGHAETNVFFMAAMGLYRDKVPLYANSTDRLLHDREFRLSELSPFAANYIIELYTCEDGTSDARATSEGMTTKHLVRFLMNEKEELLPGCPSVFCPVDLFQRALGENVGCDFADMCGIKGCPREATRKKGLVEEFGKKPELRDSLLVMQQR